MIEADRGKGPRPSSPLVDGPLAQHLRGEITPEQYLDFLNQERREYGYPPLEMPEHLKRLPPPELPSNVIPFPIKPR